MAFPRIGGSGIPLNLAAMASNALMLKPAQIWNIPAGTYLISPGPYTFIQYQDPVTQNWRVMDTAASAVQVIDSDGGNYRLANLSGCPVGGLITTAGTGYANGVFLNGIKNDGSGTVGLSVTASAGASVWATVVGGANNTITVTTAGTLYTYQPTLIVSAPPAGGIQATATCTLSGGTLNTAAFTNVGAGYTSPPTITIVNDPRDTTGSGGVLTASALTGSGTLTAMYPTNPGTVLTSVPTFTFSSGAAAATAIMNFTVTGFSVTGGGVAYGNAQPFFVLSGGGVVAGSSVLTNPASTTGLTTPRQAQLSGTSTAGGAVTATGAVIIDGGLGFQAVPQLGVISTGNSTPTTFAQLAATVGGSNDFSYVQPI